MTMTEAKKTDAERLQEIGRGAYASIVEMVAALNCDYDRLAELRDMVRNEEDNLSDFRKGEAKSLALSDDESEELSELESDAGDCEDRDDAERRIEEDALSVQVRSDWCDTGEDMTAAEFNILLATGGPAVRIIGELDRGEPVRAWLEVQDWGTPWTQYFGASQETLLDYARCFYFITPSSYSRLKRLIGAR